MAQRRIIHAIRTSLSHQSNRQLSCLSPRASAYPQLPFSDPFSHNQNSSSSSSSSSSFKPILLAAAIGAGLFLTRKLEAEESKQKPGEVVDGLPNYSMAQVAQHKGHPSIYTDDEVEFDAEADQNQLWVTYRNGVYNITEFIDLHPGSKSKILLAAGSRIDPYWAHYRQHDHHTVTDLLETMRIGNVTPEERLSEQQIAALDPYTQEPIREGDRDSRLIVRAKKPFNAETAPKELDEVLFGIDPSNPSSPGKITGEVPNPLHYKRNHLPVPKVDPETYAFEILIENPDGSLTLPPVRFTLNELKTLFPKHEVMVTIQCAGNRRNDIHKVKPVLGLGWDVGAIGNARWAGARLVDVLRHAGVTDEVLLKSYLQHAKFKGLDRDFANHYETSVPLAKAADPNNDVILAYEMNGEEIPPDHGFPVRVVVPGVVGARNVKWLHQIRLSPNESQSQWQQNDYKGFSPSTDWSNVDFKTSPAIQQLPVQSAILYPVNGTSLALSRDSSDSISLPVMGYAWSGGGRGIVRVDVSVDNGKTWQVADLHKADPAQPLEKTWAWTLWNANVVIPASDISGNEVEVICKAVDSSYNNQPETPTHIWNLRGVLNNSWHRVKVRLQ